MKQIICISFLFLVVACARKPDPKPSVQDKQVHYAIKTESVKEHYTKEQIEFLKNAGMGNSYTVRENHDLLDMALAKKHEKKFPGMKFISDISLTKFLELHELVMGELSAYIGVIPAENIEQFKNNLEIVKKADSTLQDFYFIRNTRHTGDGRFLQKISISEIPPNNINLIEGAPHGMGQANQSNGNEILTPQQYAHFKRKYGVKEIIVDRNTGTTIRIVAPKTLFNLDGNEIIGHEVKAIKRDPAIMLQVEGGWMTLTSWH